ncbi:protein RER1 isoform X1 [Oratosquilla oratoria]|uniref:protein RER1 isoform X1 n=1 Tax=Oratosquilla oratoria TaxID=337810 RepID=UPI003F76AC85
MMQDVLESSESVSQPGLIQRITLSISRKGGQMHVRREVAPDGGQSAQKEDCPALKLFQYYLDKWTPHTASRWVFTVVLIAGFLIRIFLMQGWYIICYALGIYHLNLFLAFLTPKIDPAFGQDDEDGPSLPTKANEEFRPFMRRLPEFKFWYSVTKSTLIALFCTFFQVFNVPVFWPILVMYFITLFLITMKRQIKHMIKYRYIPFTFGKPRYQTPENGKVATK